VDILPPNGSPTFHDFMLAVYKADVIPLEVLQMLKDRIEFSRKISLRECE
jgi:hypothetical protein